MGRLGLVGRLSAVVFLTLLAIFAVLAGVAYVQQETEGEAPVSVRGLSARIVAIVSVLEAAGPDTRPALLTAMSGEELHVTLSDARPALTDETAGQMPGIERTLAGMLKRTAGSDVLVRVDSGRREGRLARLIALSRADADLLVAVRLRDGGWVLMSTRGNVQLRLFGLPPGFWLAAAGFLVGGAAIWAVAREARSLRAIGTSLTAFEASADPQPIAVKGAPEIKSLIHSVNRMQQRIAALLKGRVVLLGGLSHDVKTYVTRLRLRAELIEDDDLRAKTIADLDDMTALIDDALSVARSSAAPARLERVDLESLLSGISGADVTASAEPRLDVLGDKLALKRAFSNLAENAVRYGTRARLAGRREGASAIVTVDDDGPGIPSAQREAVFEPFYRLESSRNRATGGSGLGLAIVKQIVEAHGGSIAISDAPSGGARFSVILPLDPSA